MNATSHFTFEVSQESIRFVLHLQFHFGVLICLLESLQWCRVTFMSFDIGKRRFAESTLSDILLEEENDEHIRRS